jgi:hypothetical protein
MRLTITICLGRSNLLESWIDSFECPETDLAPRFFQGARLKIPPHVGMMPQPHPQESGFIVSEEFEPALSTLFLSCELRTLPP